MPAPLAIQLYTVRDVITKRDFASVVRKIAEIGYVGVEPAGFPGTTPDAAGKLFKELGLAVPSAHTKLPLGTDKNEVLDAMAAIGCKRIISGKGPDDFKTLDAIKRVCDLFNEASAIAKANGLAVGYHNHWWEFEPVEGRLPYQVMLEHLAPDVFFQIDTYWTKVGGSDPVKVIKELGKRAPVLHIKDGPGIRGEPHLAVGSGVMDFPAIMKAAEAIVEWHIVELDACATDMMEAVEKSYAYLVGNELARGKK